MFGKRKYRKTYREQHAEQLRQQAKAYYEQHRGLDDEASEERKCENARRYRKTNTALDLSRKWHKEHPTSPAYCKAYYQEHSERLCAWGKAYREKHAGVIPARDRISRLKRLYGITQEDYDKLFIEHGGQMCNLWD